MRLSTKIEIPINNQTSCNKSRSYFKSHLPAFKHELQIIEKKEEIQKNYIEGISIPIQAILQKQKNNLSKFFKDNDSDSMYEQYEDFDYCHILHGFKFYSEDWMKIMSEDSLIEKVENIQVYKFQGKQTNKIQIIQKSKLLGPSSPKPIVCKNANNANNANKYSLIVSDCNDDYQKYSQLHKVVIQPKNWKRKIHLYYLPYVEAHEQERSQVIKIQYYTTKFLQILNQYVSLDSKTATLYKDSGHKQFQTLLYSGKILEFEFYSLLPGDQIQWVKSFDFLNKLAQISLTDKHLLEQIDSLSLIEFKKQLRKLYVEESRLRKSLSNQKNILVQEIQYLIELLDLKNVYPDKIKFATIDVNMLKRIRAQNVEKKTNWIKDQSCVCRNLDIRLDELLKKKQEYLLKQIQQKKIQNTEIQQIRQQIMEVDKIIKSEEEKNKNQNVFSMHQTKNKKKDTTESKITIKKGDNFTKEENLKDNNSKIKNGVLCKEIEGQIIDRELEIQMLEAQFKFEKQYYRKKADYNKANLDLLSYLIDC